MENTRNEFESNIPYYKKQINQQCGNCLSTENIHLHHIVPLALGGTNNLSNIIGLCEKCHGKIHGKNYNKDLQKKGIAIARAQGKFKGRKAIEYPKQWEKYYKMIEEGNIKNINVMELLNLKKTTFYKLIKQYESNMYN